MGHRLQKEARDGKVVGDSFERLPWRQDVRPKGGGLHARRRVGLAKLRRPPQLLGKHFKKMVEDSRTPATPHAHPERHHGKPLDGDIAQQRHLHGGDARLHGKGDARARKRERDLYVVCHHDALGRHVRRRRALNLDEATSSIDTRTEEIVAAGMDALMAGRTTFVIAHRLSTVKNADCICVMEHGRIVERGSHDELMAQRDRYWQLYTGGLEDD